MKRRFEWVRLIMLLAACLLIEACSERIVHDPPNTPEENFEILWQTFDRHYSFFELKKIDWDEVYAMYRPQVKDLSDQELFELCQEMLLLLKDGHVNLYTPFGNVAYREWYKNYRDNYNGLLIRRNYLDDSPLVVGNGNIKYKPLANGLGYLHIRTWGGDLRWVRDIDKVLDALKDAPALILDVRNNGGGTSNNAEFVMSRFADQRRLAYLFQYRNGPRHTDFTELFESYVEPDGPIQYTRPIALLTNRHCFSSNEMFISGLREFPHVTTIGDTTGGGAGNPKPYELPNGWEFRVPQWIEYLPDHTSYEAIGIPPDIPVHMTQADIAQERDTIMETAISFLKSQIAENAGP